MLWLLAIWYNNQWYIYFSYCSKPFVIIHFHNQWWTFLFFVITLSGILGISWGGANLVPEAWLNHGTPSAIKISMTIIKKNPWGIWKTPKLQSEDDFETGYSKFQRWQIVFALCLRKERKLKKRKRLTFSDPIVTYSHLKMTFTIHNMNYLL